MTGSTSPRSRKAHRQRRPSCQQCTCFVRNVKDYYPCMRIVRAFLILRSLRVPTGLALALRILEAMREGGMPQAASSRKPRQPREGRNGHCCVRPNCRFRLAAAAVAQRRVVIDAPMSGDGGRKPPVRPSRSFSPSRDPQSSHVGARRDAAALPHVEPIRAAITPWAARTFSHAPRAGFVRVSFGLTATPRCGSERGDHASARVTVQGQAAARRLRRP